MSQIQNIADAWARSWESADSEGFAAMFAPGAVYRDDQAGRLSQTPEELKAFHKHFAEALSDVRLTFSRVFQSGQDACLEWTFTGKHTGVFHGREPTGIAFASPGASVIRLAEDGRILSCTDYYDGGAVARALAA